MRAEWNDAKIDSQILQTTYDKMIVAIDQVKGTAIELCPTDLGALKDSIIDDVTIEENGKLVVGRVGTPVEYAPYVEFGTGENAENGQGRKGGWFFVSDRPVLSGWLKPLGQLKDGKYLYFTYGSYPHPFLRPALLENKPVIKQIFGIT